jgi:DNA-binding NarL/FixJ family response regulator
MHTSVVVVDQHPPVVAAVVGALADAGYTPVGAHHFGDAVSLLLKTKPDVVVVSVELGAFNGLHLLLRSSLELPATRVIVVGPPSPGFQSEAQELGAAAYLARPVTAAAIVEQVDRVSCAIAPPMPFLRAAHSARA